jgi:rhamnosyltransferase
MIYAQEYEGTFEVIVVDSASKDQTVAIARGFPARIYEIREGDFDYGRTRNWATMRANGRIVVNLTAHAIPIRKDWLTSLCRELDDQAVAGVYGRQVAWDWAFPMERYFLEYLYGPTRRVQCLTDRGQPEMRHTLFSNVNSAIKRELWERWPWTERGGGSEDQVWSRQALLAGYKIVYSEQAAVYHNHNYTLKQAFKRFFESGLASHNSYLPENVGAVTKFAGGGIRYLADEFAYLVKTGNAGWLPHAVLYEASKVCGLMAGRFSYYLPARIAALLRVPALSNESVLTHMPDSAR